MPAKDFKIRVKKGGYPVVLPIDGYAIDATVSRFTVAEFAAFARGFQRVTDPHSVRLVSMRMPGEEQDTKLAAGSEDRREFVITDEEIRRRRLVEMTAEQREEYERLHDEEEQFAGRFISEQLAAHLVLAPGQITEGDGEDEREITSGADFVRIYGGRRDVLQAALMAIRVQNTLPESLKNDSSSQRDSPRSLDARELDTTDTVGDGTRPEDPAQSVVPEPSATSGTVMASSEGMSSGLMVAAIE